MPKKKPECLKTFDWNQPRASAVPIQREKREREKRWIVLNHREAKDKDLDPEHGA